MGMAPSPAHAHSYRWLRLRRTVTVMTSGDRQRRDGAAKRVQLTSGDHSGPKDKRGRPARTMQPDRQQKKAAASKQWKALFARLDEVKRRDQERQQRRQA